jgi:hypothetical protein
MNIEPRNSDNLQTQSREESFSANTDLASRWLGGSVLAASDDRARPI